MPRPIKYHYGMSGEEFLAVAVHRSYHNLTQRALGFGVIVKSRCARCGCSDVEAHHPDYAKPLDII